MAGGGRGGGDELGDGGTYYDNEYCTEFCE